MGTNDPSSWVALDALVREVIETRKGIAALQAKESRLLARAVDLVITRTEERRASGRRSPADLPMREVSAELAAAMRVSDRTLQIRMGDAATLETRFAATLDAWHEGRIDAGHVNAILDAGAEIADADTRARFEARVLATAVHETAPRLRSHAHAIAAQLDPDAAAARHRRGNDARRVVIRDLGDGLGRIVADLPATLAYAIGDRLTQMAREVRAAENAAAVDDDDDGLGDEDSGGPTTAAAAIAPDGGETLDEGGETRSRTVTGPTAPASTSESTRPALRTLDHVRADVFADLLLAGAPAAHGDGDALAAITAHVQVTVPVLTLSGDDDAPALLAGYGPIDVETARRLAAGAPGWDRVLTHPHSGAVLAVDRYRPNADLRRFLAARDEHCRFPGCRRPVRRCDIDHTRDAAKGGETSARNLAHFCRRHHTVKHASEWTVRQLGGGVLEWISPIRRRYEDHPPSTVRFVPTDRIARTITPRDAIPVPSTFAAEPPF